MEPTRERPEGEGHDPLELAPLEPASGSPGAGAEERREPRGEIKAESVLKLQEEHCPKCGAVLGPLDVVCVRCGYDMRANEQRRVEQGVEEVGGEEEPEPFVTPGRGSAKLWGIVGAVVTVAAMVAAGWGTPPGKGAGVVIAAITLVLYRVLVHTGTGLVAVGIAARINEQKFGGEEALPLAASRIFVAMAAFELIVAALPPALGAFGRFAALPVGAAAYWLIVWLLFNKTRTVALVIMLAQVILWVVVQLGMTLSAWHSSELH